MFYTMKGFISASLFMCLVIAAPIQDVTTPSFQETPYLRREIRKRSNLSDTRNELQECKPVTVIFARGTTEPGNVGSRVGPPFFNALEVAIGNENMAVQGVDYPAAILGYIKDGDPAGTTKLASLVQQAVSLCPSTQIVLSGYSQGAEVVHNGIAQLTAEEAAKITAVVLFGDPFQGRPLNNIAPSKVKTFCFVEDLICKHTIIVDVFHLAYATEATPAALFVQSLVKL